MSLSLRLIIGLTLLWISGFCAGRAFADHNVYLPYVPGTPLMQQVITTQEYAWCADARATNYSNFLSQLHDVQDQYTQRVGIRHRQVAFSDPACIVKHTMPDVVDCGNCAAYIHYASKPVVIVYKWQLGYFDWGSAIGHELGHGLLGLHEQYADSGGTISCTFRSDTVMSCGPPFVKYPQALDVNRGCAIILTSWCGIPPAPVDPCLGPTNEFGQQWNNCLQRWVDLTSGWRYDPTTGIWELPSGEPEWDACDPFGNRRSLYVNRITTRHWFWPAGGSPFYSLERDLWSGAPPC